MTVLKRVVGTVFSLTAMRLGTAALAFALFWLIARWAGREDLGAYAVVMNVFLFLQQMPMLGLHLALIRDAAAAPEHLAQNRLAMTWISLAVASVLCIGILLSAASVYPPELHAPVWLVAVSLLPTAITGVTESVMLGQQRMRLVAVVNIAESVFRAVASGVLVLLGYGLSAWLGVFLAGRILAAVAYAMARETAGAAALLHGFPRDAVLRYLRMCPVFAGILVASAAFSRLDVFVLSHFSTLDAVGLYASAGKIYEVALMVSSILVSALFPLFSTTWEQVRNDFGALVERSLRWMLTLGIPAAALACLVAEPLMVLLFGEPFRPAAPILIWLVPAALLMAGNQVFSAAMLASGRQATDLASVAASACFLLACLTLFVQEAGMLGAAWAIVAGMLFQFSFRGLWFGRQFGALAMLRSIASPFGAGLAMAGAWLALQPLGGLLAATGGLAAYLAVGMLFGIVRKEERAYLRAGVGRLLRKSHQ